MLIPDAPDIAKTMRTGYPDEPYFGRDCPQCDGEIKENSNVYELNGVEVCEACFKEWVIDLLDTNPEMVADALHTVWHIWEG